VVVERSATPPPRRPAHHAPVIDLNAYLVDRDAFYQRLPAGYAQNRRLEDQAKLLEAYKKDPEKFLKQYAGYQRIFLFDAVTDAKNMVRVGAFGDGGKWVSDPQSLRTGAVVYAFGASYEISFDAEMAGLYGCEVHCFDPTPSVVRYFARCRPDFDLRSMSWGDGSRVPTSGNKRVIVGTDDEGLLHIRIFDAKGETVTDTYETKLPADQAAEVATLKRRLRDLLPPHVPTDDEKAQVLGEVTSIVGQNLRPGQPVGKGTFRFHALGLGPVSLEPGKADDLVLEDQKCEVKRLDQIAAELGHSHVDILKMDIEGGEMAALTEILTSGTLARLSVEQLLVEFHLWDDEYWGSFVRVIGLLREQGYLLFRKEFNPVSSEDCAEFSFIRSDAPGSPSS
jgi:hypothetical protein